MARLALGGAVIAALLGGCNSPAGEAPTARATAESRAQPGPSATGAPSTTAAASGAGSAAPAPGVPGSAAPAPSGGASSGPSAAAAPSAAPEAPPVAACGTPAVQLPFTGPALLSASGGEVKVVFDDAGVPRLATPPAPPTKGDKLALADPAKKATSPACVRAGDKFACVDTSGSIHRSIEDGRDDKVIAQARPGAPISAAKLGSSHVVVAFLGDRKTTEGAVTLAFAALDDQTPMLLSEEGSGATYVAVTSSGDRVIAAYVDARRAMTPVHAREVRLATNGKLEFGKDAVAFVGEGADARTSCSLVNGAAGPMALVPIGDGAKFGMAAVQLGLKPADDAPTTWSTYPNGCTPAPLAATGEFPAKVARVRPITRDPKSRRTLELGDLDAGGAFTPICTLWEASTFRDVAVARDARGSVWVAFTDGDGSWLVRHGPKP
jgi:hypothetical protein